MDQSTLDGWQKLQSMAGHQNVSGPRLVEWVKDACHVIHFFRRLIWPECLDLEIGTIMKWKGLEDERL